LSWSAGVRLVVFFFFSSRRRHTRFSRDWSSDVCSSDLGWDRRGGYARGAWEIKEDQTARIHKGEMILPSRMAGAVRNALSDDDRSEERRVGKERRSRWRRRDGQKHRRWHETISTRR